MSIKSEAERIQANIAAAYTAASAKGATMPMEQNSDNLAEAVESIPAGGTSAPVVEKDVNFWDYDGTLLYSYTLEEAQAMTELPAGPDWHDGLIFDGWNWTLEQLEEQGTKMDVCALYTTEDGATWFILVNDLNRSVKVTFRWKQYIDDGAILDFGDGSALYTTSGTGDLNVTHEYAQGNYIAKISGGYNLAGMSNHPCIDDIDTGGSHLLRRVHVTCNYLYAYSFMYCFSLECMSLSKNTAFSGAYIFNACGKLRFAIAPTRPDISGISSGVYGSCSSAKRISVSHGSSVITSVPPNCNKIFLPDTITTITAMANNNVISELRIPPRITSLPARFAQSCTGIAMLNLPESIENISSYAFNGCSGMRLLKFLTPTPPTVANANAFEGIPTDCVVEVPAASLEAYQNATNYSGIAAQMIGV